MEHYRRTLLIQAPAATVYRALTTTAGLQGWWCDLGRTDTHVGGEASFTFGPNHKRVRLDVLAPEREVRWHCVHAEIHAPGVSNKAEWIGTEMVFRLGAEGRATRVEFEHIGLTAELQCIDICTSGWNYFLDSLQQWCETSVGTPYRNGEACMAQAASAGAQAATA